MRSLHSSGLLMIIAAVCSLAACSASSDASGSGTSNQTESAVRVTVLPTYTVSDANLFPEGATYDPVEHAFYAGSLSHGNVTKLTARGVETVFVPESTPPRATLGMKVDAVRRRLWVCSVRNDKAHSGTVSGFDLATGEAIRDFVLAKTFPDASCNDLALDDEGRIYVTDRENPVVYRLDPATGTDEVWAADPMLGKRAILGIGMNGIAFTPDRSAVIVTKYAPAELYRISVKDPSDVRKVELHGDSFSGGALDFLAGADGILFVKNDLYVAFDAKGMRVTADDASWSSATVRSAALGPGLGALVVAEGELFGVHGDPIRFVTTHKAKRPFTVSVIDTTLFDD